jgi:hypothetical protein
VRHNLPDQGGLEEHRTPAISRECLRLCRDRTLTRQVVLSPPPLHIDFG